MWIAFKFTIIVGPLPVMRDQRSLYLTVLFKKQSTCRAVNIAFLRGGRGLWRSVIREAGLNGRARDPSLSKNSLQVRSD
jgi:hypothetical protein